MCDGGGTTANGAAASSISKEHRGAALSSTTSHRKTREGLRPRRAKNRPSKIPWPNIIASLLILAGMTVFLYPHTASWFSQREQSRVTEKAMATMMQPPNSDAAYRARQIELAHQYNDALASGAVLNAGANIAVGEGISSNGELIYDELLAVGDEGFMGRLRYESLGIDLPVYHGTEEETLERGVGHLEGTSLPVGGVGTRSVLTAHRGLPTATQFNELDEAEVGDIFTVSVLDQILTYEVTETQVISPDDTQAIVADPDKDLMTLITCTPLGINSHRILVTAERVTPTPEREVTTMATVPDIPGFPWWSVAFGLTFLMLAVYLWSAFRSRWREISTSAAESADTSNADGESVN